MFKYGKRERYDAAQSMIKNGKWVVDPKEGQIFSRNHRWSGRPLGTPRDGYQRVVVPCHDGEYRYVSAHRVIWEYVHGSSDLDLTINHKNGDTLDNSIQNLELVTNRDNALHGHRVLGRANQSRNKGTSNPQAKLNEDKAREIKKRLVENNGKGGTKLAKEFGVSPMTISNIKHGVLWKDV